MIEKQKENFINQIKDDFDEIIHYSYQKFPSNYQKINSTPILEEWYEAKKNFIDLFDGNLIYDAGFHSFELDETSRIQKLNRFINLIRDDYNLPDLARFLKVFRKQFFTTQKTISSIEFLDFKEEEGYVPVKIPKGTKIIKAFKYYVENTATLERLQNMASQLIQENKISGNLFLSVHPLDYLSISENTNHWRSCHSLDGDFRAGNLSYMCDSATIVCYICGNDKKELPNFGEVKWNSKKWRMLLFTSTNNNLIFAGRHYPFFCKNVMENIKSVWESFFKGEKEYSQWSDYQEDKNLDDATIFVNDYYVSLSECVKDMSSLHFNDLLESTVYDPYYAYTKEWTGESLYIGSHPPCPICGRESLLESNELIGEECSDIFYSLDFGFFVGFCSACANSIYEAQGFTIDNEGFLYCRHCADALLSQCESCRQYFKKTTMADESGTICCNCASHTHE